MVKLRLKRYGKKREVSYRIVAIQSSARRDGRPLEELGFYNPRTDETHLDVPAIVKRLKEGAQPTETVRNILRKANVLEQVRAWNTVFLTSKYQSRLCRSREIFDRAVFRISWTLEHTLWEVECWGTGLDSAGVWRGG